MNARASFRVPGLTDWRLFQGPLTRPTGTHHAIQRSVPRCFRRRRAERPCPGRRFD